MLLLPLDQARPHIDSPRERLIPQRLLVPRPKAPERVLATRRALVELIEAPHVRLKVLAVLGMHGVGLSLGTGGVEDGGDEELSEAVEGAGEGGGVDVEAVCGRR